MRMPLLLGERRDGSGRSGEPILMLNNVIASAHVLYSGRRNIRGTAVLLHEKPLDVSHKLDTLLDAILTDF